MEEMSHSLQRVCEKKTTERRPQVDGARGARRNTVVAAKMSDLIDARYSPQGKGK